MSEPDLIRRKEVAELLGVSPPNVSKWLRKKGVLPAGFDDEHPVGRKGGGTTPPALYDRAQVVAARDRWLAERDRDADDRRRASALARTEGT